MCSVKIVSVLRKWWRCAVKRDTSSLEHYFAGSKIVEVRCRVERSIGVRAENKGGAYRSVKVIL